MRSEILEKLGVNVKNKDNIIKFLPILSMVDDKNLDNKIKILKFHKIPITRLSQLKILTLESSELERRITISKSNNFFVEVINNPLTLLNFSKFTLKKKKNGPVIFNTTVTIPVKEEKKIEFIEYLDTDEAFDEFLVNNAFSFTKEDKSEVKPLKKSVLNNAEYIENLDDFGKTAIILQKPLTQLLNEESYERYENLSTMINNILKAMDFEFHSATSEIEDNLIKLVVGGEYSDKDALYKSFSYNMNLNSEDSNKLRSVISFFLSKSVEEA